MSRKYAAAAGLPLIKSAPFGLPADRVKSLMQRPDMYCRPVTGRKAQGSATIAGYLTSYDPETGLCSIARVDGRKDFTVTLENIKYR